jgi:outer membrane protein TolC
VKRTLLLLLLIWAGPLFAQEKVFSAEEFIAVVKKFHPVIKLAANDVRIASWDITASRDVFDPKWQSRNSRKNFDGVTYYRQSEYEIRIPTWYGLDLHAGQENINGNRINPEQTKGSISYIGFSVPLLQNLVMDKRRAALLLAKTYFGLSDVERQIIVNDLLKESLEVYWNWWEQYQIYNLMKKALQNAEKRAALVKSGFLIGERPAIDTLEALTQVQSFQIKVSEAYTEYTKAQLAVMGYLWTESGGQGRLSSDVFPQSPGPSSFYLLADVLAAAENHPEIKQYAIKLKTLDIEKKLNFQQLLPMATLTYNQLGRDLNKTVNASWFANNYNYAISVSLPLRLSKARADLATTKLKIENTRLGQDNKQVSLRMRVMQYYAEWQQTTSQLGMQEELVKNISALQRAEEIRFANGEGNLFLINSREMKTIEAEQKFIELQAKNTMAGVKLQWASGLLM